MRRKKRDLWCALLFLHSRLHIKSHDFTSTLSTIAVLREEECAMHQDTLVQACVYTNHDVWLCFVLFVPASAIWRSVAGKRPKAEYNRRALAMFDCSIEFNA